MCCKYGELKKGRRANCEHSTGQVHQNPLDSSSVWIFLRDEVLTVRTESACCVFMTPLVTRSSFPSAAFGGTYHGLVFFGACLSHPSEYFDVAAGACVSAVGSAAHVLFSPPSLQNSPVGPHKTTMNAQEFSAAWSGAKLQPIFFIA